MTIIQRHSFQGEHWRPYTRDWQERDESEEAFRMTLIFALLRNDHIVFASDRRHVEGDREGRYVHDDCWKTEPIVHNCAMLGFAGHDLTEQIVMPLRADGTLNGAGSVKAVADAIGEKARALYTTHFPDWSQAPNVEFLITGFMPTQSPPVAMAYVVALPSLYPNEYRFTQDLRSNNYVLIGKRRHGALYAFHKCASSMTTEKAGVRLACFTLAEVGRYDNSVGGRPQICVIRPDKPVDDLSDDLKKELAWSERVGTKIGKLIAS